VSARLFLRAFFFATALPYGLSNDSSKIRFPFFGVWFPRGGWLAYLCLFAGQNAAAHAANLAFGELLNHYAAHKEKGDKKSQQPQQFSLFKSEALAFGQESYGREQRKWLFYPTHAATTLFHQKQNPFLETFAFSYALETREPRRTIR